MTTTNYRRYAVRYRGLSSQRVMTDYVIFNKTAAAVRKMYEGMPSIAEVVSVAVER